jgi:hypothetical protein
VTSSAAELSIWDVIAREAARESSLWAAALRPDGVRDETPVFSPLGPARFALGLESIYEGYLLHYGRPRLFAPADSDTAILLGDYLYAHGLVRVAAHGEVEVVADLAALISRCAQLRAEGLEGDGAAWAGTVVSLGTADPRPDADLDAVSRALALHDARVD